MTEKQKIKLFEKLTQILIDMPESGMGYHKVDVYLKNGTIIKNQVVLNCAELVIDKSIIISVDEIENFVLSDSND